MSDLISRQEAIKAIKFLIDEDDPYDEGYNFGLNSAILELKHRIPSAEKVGKWVIDRYDLRGKETCSVCGQDVIGKGWDRLYAYCPNCGARMERSE